MHHPTIAKFNARNENIVNFNRRHTDRKKWNIMNCSRFRKNHRSVCGHYYKCTSYSFPQCHIDSILAHFPCHFSIDSNRFGIVSVLFTFAYSGWERKSIEAIWSATACLFNVYIHVAHCAQPIMWHLLKMRWNRSVKIKMEMKRLH